MFVSLFFGILFFVFLASFFLFHFLSLYFSLFLFVSSPPCFCFRSLFYFFLRPFPVCFLFLFLNFRPGGRRTSSTTRAFSIYVFRSFSMVVLRSSLLNPFISAPPPPPPPLKEIYLYEFMYS